MLVVDVPCISVFVKRTNVSGSSYPNSQISSATLFKYRRSSSLFAPEPMRRQLAPPQTEAFSFQLVIKRLRRILQSAASIVAILPDVRERARCDRQSGRRYREAVVLEFEFFVSANDRRNNSSIELQMKNCSADTIRPKVEKCQI